MESLHLQAQAFPVELFSSLWSFITIIKGVKGEFEVMRLRCSCVSAGPQVFVWRPSLYQTNRKCLWISVSQLMSRPLHPFPMMHWWSCLSQMILRYIKFPWVSARPTLKWTTVSVSCSWTTSCLNSSISPTLCVLISACGMWSRTFAGGSVEGECSDESVLFVLFYRY